MDIECKHGHKKWANASGFYGFGVNFFADAQVCTDVPGLRGWFPVPMDDSKFTVVTSPFITVSERGKARTTHDGRELARLLYTRLESGAGSHYAE